MKWAIIVLILQIGVIFSQTVEDSNRCNCSKAEKVKIILIKVNNDGSIEPYNTNFKVNNTFDIDKNGDINKYIKKKIKEGNNQKILNESSCIGCDTDINYSKDKVDSTDSNTAFRNSSQLQNKLKLKNITRNKDITLNNSTAAPNILSEIGDKNQNSKHKNEKYGANGPNKKPSDLATDNITVNNVTNKNTSKIHAVPNNIAKRTDIKNKYDNISASHETKNLTGTFKKSLKENHASGVKNDNKTQLNSENTENNTIVNTNRDISIKNNLQINDIKDARINRKKTDGERNLTDIKPDTSQDFLVNLNATNSNKTKTENELYKDMKEDNITKTDNTVNVEGMNRRRLYHENTNNSNLHYEKSSKDNSTTLNASITDNFPETISNINEMKKPLSNRDNLNTSNLDNQESLEHNSTSLNISTVNDFPETISDFNETKTNESQNIKNSTMIENDTGFVMNVTSKSIAVENSQNSSSPVEEIDHTKHNKTEDVNSNFTNDFNPLLYKDKISNDSNYINKTKESNITYNDSIERDEVTTNPYNGKEDDFYSVKASVLHKPIIDDITNNQSQKRLNINNEKQKTIKDVKVPNNSKEVSNFNDNKNIDELEMDIKNGKTYFTSENVVEFDKNDTNNKHNTLGTNITKNESYLFNKADIKHLNDKLDTTTEPHSQYPSNEMNLNTFNKYFDSNLNDENTTLSNRRTITTDDLSRSKNNVNSNGIDSPSEVSNKAPKEMILLNEKFEKMNKVKPKNDSFTFQTKDRQTINDDNTDTLINGRRNNRKHNTDTTFERIRKKIVRSKDKENTADERQQNKIEKLRENSPKIRIKNRRVNKNYVNNKRKLLHTLNNKDKNQDVTKPRVLNNKDSFEAVTSKSYNLGAQDPYKRNYKKESNPPLGKTNDPIITKNIPKPQLKGSYDRKKIGDSFRNYNEKSEINKFEYLRSFNQNKRNIPDSKIVGDIKINVYNKPIFMFVGKLEENR